jgi:hypothetical protein
MPLSRELMAFVQAAVRLPQDRLKRIDRDWERLYPHRAVLVELVQGSEQVREEVRALRAYVVAEARRAAAEHPEERLIPEDVVDAVLPAARAVLLRRVLESSDDQRRVQAFATLTEPFVDILPKWA